MSDKPETDEVVERIAAAADAAAEHFMERYRQRPNGEGERFYDLYDVLSTFASELRTPPASEGGEA